MSRRYIRVTIDVSSTIATTVPPLTTMEHASIQRHSASTPKMVTLADSMLKTNQASLSPAKAVPDAAQIATAKIKVIKQANQAKLLAILERNFQAKVTASLPPLPSNSPTFPPAGKSLNPIEIDTSSKTLDFAPYTQTQPYSPPLCQPTGCTLPAVHNPGTYVANPPL
jgi:hypothetical protein